MALLWYQIAQTLPLEILIWSLASRKNYDNEMKSTTLQEIACTQNKTKHNSIFFYPLVCEVGKATIFLFYRRES